MTAADKTSIGEYTLSIQGADTTAPPFTVTSTNPASWRLLGYQVSSMDVQFSDSVLLSSLSDSDFTINGNPATSFTVNASQRCDVLLPDHDRRCAERLDQRSGRHPRHRR